MSLVEFDEWKEEFGVNDSKYSIEHYLMEQAFKAGQKSQQEEVDRLQTEVDELQNKLDYHIETNADLARLVLELRARVDGSLKILEGMRHNGAYKAIDILRGNKDEQ